MTSPEELHTRFTARIDMLAEKLQCESKTNSWLREIYDEEWFRENQNKYLPTEDSILFQCPKGIVTLLADRSYQLIDYYILATDQMIRRIGERFNEQDKKRLRDWNLSFETYFELRMLDLLARSGFSILERDSQTSRKRDVEAIVSIDNFKTHVECKVLNTSVQTYIHLYSEQLFMHYTLKARMDYHQCLTGKIEFDQDLSKEDWQIIFKVTNTAFNSGKTEIVSGKSFRGKIAFVSLSELEYAKNGHFSFSYNFPVNTRIKSTLDKALKKLKGVKKCILFICVSMYSGQQGAHREIVKLLQNKKYKKILTVFLVDPKDTFEHDYMNIWAIHNYNNDALMLNWDDTQRVIVLEKTFSR